jgi:hypothetical protein
MEITLRELITVMHGMLFGGFYLLALFGAIMILLDRSDPAASMSLPTPRWQTVYFVLLVATGWAAVLTGAYVIYPWYRAVPPVGADLTHYPKFLLTSHSSTAGWHNFGMEWKEHVAWIAPMASTMVAWVLLRHRAAWNAHRAIRSTVFGFAAAAFLAAAIAGGWGAMIDKRAPVEGGQSLQLMENTK